MSEEKFPGKIKIQLQTAQEWEKKYRDSKPAEGKEKVNAYLIPKETLELVLAENIDAVRAYIGINDLGEQILMFVGTVLNEKTGIYEDVFAKGDIGYDNSIQEIVYDG
ncbi:hypothetical protein OIU83_22390 [Flavobacterium sp. LS1R49]|uniref:Uncharacterized protein n=1 Tax=Flavobacterium shii TaxID=2987687 RepID=A0A9X2ZKE1_9FLAO|nr:hypothetical protein [Flavobacterium shii]MCV9930426.1 hypothetical protein [Flavobacterium shii]